MNDIDDNGNNSYDKSDNNDSLIMINVDKTIITCNDNSNNFNDDNNRNK